MIMRRTFATTARVLKQLRHDHRTMAMILLVPVLLMTIIKYVFYGDPQLFNSIAPAIMGIFPLVIMFLITSIATLRERTSGTLDRLMTQPVSRGDFIFGYAFAFSIVGFVQACVVSVVTLGLLDVKVQGGTLPVLITAVAASFLGTSLGLFVSAFARNEFQAVQLVMPIIMPQVLLCGLFIARDQMAPFLQNVSKVLPLTYSVDAMKQATTQPVWTSRLTYDLIVVVFFGLAALVFGAETIKRQE